MLTCIARPKQRDEADESKCATANKQAIKTLTSQIKDMTLKASGSACRSCNPCTGAAMMTPQQQLQKSNEPESDLSTSVSERFRWPYKRNGSKNSSSGRVWGKEMEARLKGISMGGDVSLSASASGRRPDPIVLEEENEPKEWVAQVEPGVLITFVSLPRGGNDLKRIRFSREMFNKWQAQKWWQDNYDKVMELYNVQRLNRQAFPLPTPPRSEDEVGKHNDVFKYLIMIIFIIKLILLQQVSIMKFECNGDSPITPPLNKERLPRNLYRPMGMGYSSSDSLDHTVGRSNRDSSGLTATPKLSSISGAKTETSSMDASIRTSSSREADRSGELSISNVSDIENEWVEQDEPGVYITIKALPCGPRELKRVRFSRDKFGEVHARLWWEENRTRIHKQYL
ncbi:protein Brevis radix-like 4 [Bidens hawaiensis]|uniref:protein Brevis radix-like 4 n=1 Tax=Bidens hawaiensis TaxID=980011 RepID=UPI00404A8E70